MGVVASEFDKACSCSCEDACAAKYGDNAGGQMVVPPDYMWQEEVCRFEETSSNHIHGNYNQQAPALDSRHSDRSPLPSPGRSSGSPPRSPGNQRQSWQDLDADGNYHLHFMFRPSDRFGLQLVEFHNPPPDGLLVVAQVEQSGSFASTAKHSPGLFAGDVIMQVNRRNGTAAALRDTVNQVATNGGELSLVVQSRPAAFDVYMKRDGPNWKKLGLSVAIDRADSIPRMRVRTVRNEGLIPKWNETHGSLRICTGDWITQVNGIIKSAEEMFAMVQATKEGHELELRIETPARDGPREEMNIASPRSSPRAHSSPDARAR